MEAGLTLKPGVERWAVKTGVDALASTVATVPVQTAIADLVALAAPADPDLVADRDAPTEVTLYQVAATLTGYKLEQDGDYHLVIADSNGATMIAEIPDPDFCAGSVWLSQITQARAAFDAKFGPQVAALKILAASLTEGVPMITKVQVPVTLVGVGFFDRLHGQTGVAPNGVELHPVLSFTAAA